MILFSAEAILASSPHLSYHVVWPIQFIGKTVSVYVEGMTTNSVKHFCLEELVSCGTTDKNNIMNIALVNAAVTETLHHGTHGISEIFMYSSSYRAFDEREINAVDLDGRPRRRRQCTFATFTLCPETDVPSRKDGDLVISNTTG